MTHSHQGDIIVLSSFLITALLVTLIAWSIKYKKQLSFIAGYDEKTCNDKEGLANHVGGTLFITGILCTALALTAFLLPTYAKHIIAIYIVLLVVGTLIAALGGSKYLKSS
jgi:hypothetical protein